MRAVLIAAVLAVTAAVLGATVMREPIAYAAERFPSFVVANTADNPVPVSSADQTDLVATAELSSGNPILNLDVRQYRELRFAASTYACSGKDPGLGSSLIVSAAENGKSYRVRETELCYVGGGIVPTFQDELMQTLTIPGRTITIELTGRIGTVDLAVLGRRN